MIESIFTSPDELATLGWNAQAKEAWQHVYNKYCDLVPWEALTTRQHQGIGTIVFLSRVSAHALWLSGEDVRPLYGHSSMWLPLGLIEEGWLMFKAKLDELHYEEPLCEPLNR